MVQYVPGWDPASFLLTVSLPNDQVLISPPPRMDSQQLLDPIVREALDHQCAKHMTENLTEINTFSLAEAVIPITKSKAI